MKDSQFSNLEFGKIYYCCGSEYNFASLDTIRCAVADELPNYMVEVLETDSQWHGSLVARRFNLGVVDGGYGVLVAAARMFNSLDKGVSVLAKALLDVESFRNERVLYIDSQSFLGGPVGLDTTDVEIKPLSDGRRDFPSCSFWQKLKMVPADNDKKSSPFSNEILKKIFKSSKVSPSKRADDYDGDIHFINFEINVPVGACDDEKPAESRPSQKCYGEDLPVECDAYFESETDTVISEQEALAKKIADLIRVYIMKYGTVDNEKIRLLLRGKMTLSSDGISTLVVNKNCEIILRDIDELQLQLGGPINAALYILFLRHPDGFTRKELPKYKSELLDIYSIIAPNFNTDPVLNLVESDSRVNQVISKINNRIKAALPVGDRADCYCIRGERGKNYKVNIASMPDKVQIMPKF